MRRFLFSLVLLAGCSAVLPSTGVLPAPQTASRKFPTRLQATLPPEILYALGGNPRSQKASIDVFDAQGSSASPTPLYSISPDGNSGFGLLAVDAANNLFAEKFYPSGGGKLYMFPPGKTKPSATCLLKPYAVSMYLARGVLYLARGASSIQEYAEPIPQGSTCPKPLRTLNDARAKRYGSGLYGVVVDPHGNVFDVWMSVQTHDGFIDEFANGSGQAREFANLGAYAAPFYLASDRNGDIITSLDEYDGSRNDAIAVFPHGSNKPKLFYPTAGGYGGVALGGGDRELFAVATYTSAAIRVFTYNPKTANLGYEEKRSFPNVRGDSIAVFSQ